MEKWIAALILAGVLLMAGMASPEPVKNQGELSILSYNIHHGVDYNQVYDLSNIAKVIETTGAGIVALQEVDVNWGARSYMTDQVAWLANRLTMKSAFAPALQNQTGFYGVGILSKYPIVHSEYHLLPGKLERRVLLVAQIDVEGTMIYVFNTHLGLSAEDRALQVEKILEVVKQYEYEHKILLGDFNTLSDAPELAPLKQYFCEEEKGVGLGSNETLIGRKQRIDSIFVSPSVVIQKLVTLVYSASDHFPLYARVLLR